MGGGSSVWRCSRSVALGVALVSLPTCASASSVSSRTTGRTGIEPRFPPLLRFGGVWTYLRDEEWWDPSDTRLPRWRYCQVASPALPARARRSPGRGRDTHRLRPDHIIRGYKLLSPYALLMDWVPGFATMSWAGSLPGRHTARPCLRPASGSSGCSPRSVAGPVPWRSRSGYCAFVADGTLPAIPLRSRAHRGRRFLLSYRWLAEHGERGRSSKTLSIVHRGGAGCTSARIIAPHRRWLRDSSGHGDRDPCDHEPSRPPRRFRTCGQRRHRWILVHRDHRRRRRTRGRGPLPPGLEVVGASGRGPAAAGHHPRRPELTRAASPASDTPRRTARAPGPDCRGGEIPCVWRLPTRGTILEARTRSRFSQGTSPGRIAVFPHHTVRMKSPC